MQWNLGGREFAADRGSDRLLLHSCLPGGASESPTSVSPGTQTLP